MPSPQSSALHDMLVTMTARSTAQPPMGLASLRDMLDKLQSLSSEPTDVTYEETVAGDRPAIWANPAGAIGDRVVLYFHGGAFMGNSMHSHRKLAAHLAKAASSRALVVEFRLAPENPFPAQLDDAEAAYLWLLKDQGIPPGQIVSAGDSGGGSLATALVVRLRESRIPLPAAIVALSPWFDLEAGAPSLQENAGKDPFLNAGLLLGLAGMFLGEHESPRNPLANPLYADLDGLPPIYLLAGDEEGLRDDAVRFAARARSAGVTVELDIEPGQQHVFPIMAGRAPEADAALTRIGSWLQQQLA